MTTKILILYYSRHGHTKKLAHTIARGVHLAEGCESIVASVPEIVPSERTAVWEDLPATQDLLKQCDGLIVGAPSWYGGQPAAMKHFWDQTTPQWMNGTLVNKPAAVFGSSNSMHGGHEAVLLNGMLPLLHHGMLIVGNAYTEKSLNDTAQGGAPYGAGHVETQSHESLADESDSVNDTVQLDANEKSLALYLGKRVALISQQLKHLK